ncbi:MAG TPA: ATP-binding cassette domain-containing protein [Candidatus Polarisedimenticolia bacterium]|nr:ATP-binding cassette domain-containing protein [Candidatus Polarisedimenticolia bacterium]
MSGSPPHPAISFHDVRKSYEGRSVLDGVTFEIQRGETLVLLGSSGCGKTTALKMVNRLVEPTSGTVRVDGRDVKDWDPIRLRRGTGYVIQEAGLLPHLDVERNVEMVPRLEGWDAGRRARRVAELLELVGLDPGLYRHKQPRQLSGGERQRVGVARALAADPPVLLMDEPFGALDPITRARLQHEFMQLARRLAKTILFVTHDLLEAFRLATRVAVMKDGRIRQIGTAEEIRSYPADDFVREFIASHVLA